MSAAPGGAEPTVCDAVTQSGCEPGQKCTWVVDLDATSSQAEIGHVACVAAGPLPVGSPCDDAVTTVNGGADQCAAGALCIAGACKPICDPQLVDGAPGACPISYACSTYTGVFESAGNPIAGVCEPGCDPLSQQLLVGAESVEGAAACGSLDPTMPSASCVASDGFRSFHCSPSSPAFYAKTDRVAPFATTDGAMYINGCAPGFIPFYYEDASGAMTTVCTGLCAPLKVDQTIAAAPAHAHDNKGDAGALGKLVADPAPVAGHATCDTGIKGSQDAEDCRFVWYPLAHGDPSNALDSPYNDTLGVCFAYDKYLTVTVPGMVQKVAEKSCAALPATAADNDPYGSASDNGCYPLAESMAGATVRPSTWAAQFRVAHAPGLAARHVLE